MSVLGKKQIQLILAGIFFILCNCIQAQNDLRVQYLFSGATEDLLSICGDEREHEMIIENISAVPLTGITASINLPTGVFYLAGSAASGDGITQLTADPPVFTIGDLAAGEIKSFTYYLDADCSAIGIATSGNSINYSTDFTYTGGNGAQTDEVSPNFEVLKPTLSFPTIVGNYVTSNVFDADLGSIDTLTVDLVNGNDGALRSLTYCVYNGHPQLDFRGLSINGINVPQSYTDGDTLYYELTQPVINEAITFAGNTIQDPDLFQFNEVLRLKEAWEVIDCPGSGNAPDIERKAFYGCDGSTSCEETPISFSGVRFGFRRPDLWAGDYYVRRATDTGTNSIPPFRERDEYSDCYAEDTMSYSYAFINTGDAVLLLNDFNLELHERSYITPFQFIENEVTYYFKDGPSTSAPVSITAENVRTQAQQWGATTWWVDDCYGDASGAIRLDFQNEGILIPPGDTLIVRAPFEHAPVDCGVCNETAHVIFNWARPQAEGIVYSDQCQSINFANVQGGSTYWQRLYLRQFPEGDANIYPGEPHTLTYPVTDVNWHMLNDRCTGATSSYPNRDYAYPNSPNAYVEFMYVLPESIDWAGTDGDLNTAEHQFVDIQGDVYPVYDIEYTDNNGGNDTLYVRYQTSDPVCFDNLNAQFRLNTVVDCAEASTPFCDRTVTYQKHSYYVTECARDGTLCKERVDVRRDFNVSIHNCTCAPCEGIVFTFSNFERTNFDAPDADNDGIDEGGVLDTALLATKRFISGDTLRAIYEGRVNLMTQPNFNYVFSAIQIPVIGTFGDEGITPLGAELTIFDNSTGGEYTCNLIPQFIDGQQIISDLSADRLASLGCALPPGFVYEQDDSLVVHQFFRIQDYTRTAQQTVNFSCEFFASDADYDLGTKFQCNTQNGSMTYINYRAYNDWLERSVTGCDDGGDATSAWRDWHRSEGGIGGRGTDEFPFEIRNSFIPKQQIFVNNSDLEWGETFSLRVSDYNGYLTDTGGTLDAQEYSLDIATNDCIVINGDTLTIDVACALAGVGFERFDEGLLMCSTPHLSPTCKSEYTTPYTNKEIDAYTVWDVNESMFGSPELIMVDTSIAVNDGYIDPWNNAVPDNYIFSDESVQAYDYVRLEGLPNVQLVVANLNQTLASEDACFELEITNFGDAGANNVHFTFENESGAVIVREVRDRVSGAVLPVNLGVVELGSLEAGDIRSLELCVTSNNCMSDSLQINTGWDCGGYPVSAPEAQCTDPTTVYLEIPDSELGMIIRSPDPQQDYIIDLCSEMEYIVQISSSDVGYIHDIEYFFALPPGHEFIDGSFEIAYPVPVDGTDTTWVATATQPVTVGTRGNVYNITLDPEDPVLAAEGLVGTTNLTENFFLIRYRTFVGCGVTSGARIRMFSRAKNPCDQIANYRFSPGPRVRVAGVSNTYISQLQTPTAPVLNACTSNEIPIDVEFSLDVGSLPIGSGDSILVQLPEGVEYVPGSYTPISNAEPASGTNPLVETVGEGQYLFIDLQDGVTAGQSVQLSFDIRARDVAQVCRDYELIISTFNAQELVCQTTGELCNVRNVSDEVSVPITIEKPDLFLENFTATLTAQPPTTEQLDFCVDVTNIGTDITAGTSTTIAFYNDTNNDGDVDLGVDDLLGTAVFTDQILSGETVNLCGSTPIPGGLSCNIMAYINPELTCACNPSPSFRVAPEFIQNFSPRDYTVCSDELITGIGPAAMNNVTYEWVGIDGASLTGFSSTTTTPADFQFRNTTGSPINWSYYLRTVRNNDCVSLDTINITIQPEQFSRVRLQACDLGDFELSGPLGKTNYSWTPTAGLSDPTAQNPRVDVAQYGIGTHTFYLTYTDENGCPGSFESEATVVQCAPTYIGNYVWCDENNNGIQDENTPLSGVVVELFNSTDPLTPIATTVSASDGYYRFGPLPQGEYIIGLDLETSNYQSTLKDATTDDLDNDLNANYQTDPIFLTLGDSLMTVDLGVLCPAVDLELTKDIFADQAENPVPTPVAAGDLVWWKIEVCNRTLGTDTLNFAADSIQIMEALPPEVVFRTASTTLGTYNNATNIWSIDRLDNGDCAVLWIQTELLNGADCAPNYAQIFSAADPDIDSTPGNGNGTTANEDDEASAKVPIDVYDYGDLPDGSGGFGSGDYQTLSDNNGPRHRIIPDLFLGDLVDNEDDGRPSAQADGDALGDDGTTFNPGMLLVPGNTLNLPLRVTNGTGITAHVEAWIDWNGDGDFDDPGEMILDLDDGTMPFAPFYQITIPPDAILGQDVGVRYRLSNSDNMTPYGEANSGEVEDYLIRMSCPPKVSYPVQLRLD